MVETFTGRATIRLHNGDCMEALRGIGENEYELAIVDPPYGIGVQKQRKNSDRSTAKWKNPTAYAYKTFDDSAPPDVEYFTELRRVSQNQIIWGGNYFASTLPISKGWIVWDKKADIKEHLSMCELAWSSYDKKCNKFEFLWAGFKKAKHCDRIHPTQKPIALYKWLLANYANEGDRILDTHGGSMSIAIACWDLGFDLDLWELDSDYFAAGVDRLQRHISQGQFDL